MIKKISQGIHKIPVDSNAYLLLLEEPILIDTGPAAYKEAVNDSVKKIIPLEKIKKILLTHIHFDHCGNVDLFPDAEIYAAKKEIEDFKKNPEIAFNLKPEIIQQLKEKLTPIEELTPFLEKNNIEMIGVPGHTAGSIALFEKKQKILFSGDCLFENGIGRCDLPNSTPETMEKSLKKLKNKDYKILAPGHDY